MKDLEGGGWSSVSYGLVAVSRSVVNVINRNTRVLVPRSVVKEGLRSTWDGWVGVRYLLSMSLHH